MLREYYSTNEGSEQLLIDIPKGTYVPVFKFVNEGNLPDSEGRNTEEIFEANDVRLYRKATVAVFPFRNLSADVSKNYFAEGFSEQLCVELAKFQHLSEISYSYYAASGPGTQKGDSEMQNLLDVDYAIMGTTRFFDGLVQINVELIQTETDAILWSQTFVREFNPEHILILQEDVIQQILYKIADNDGIITRNIANAPPAKKKKIFGVYDAVYSYLSLRGRYDAESFDKVKLAIEQALILDPNNALLCALSSRLSLNHYIFKTLPDAEDLDAGKAFAEKALWLDQNCQYAYKALAWCHLLSGRTSDCSETIEQCLDLNPNAPSIMGDMGFLNICIGKYAQGFHLLLKTLSSNPILPWYCNIGFALYYYRAAAYHEAYGWAQKAQPADMPFISLLAIAMEHRVKNSSANRHREPISISHLTQHPESIMALFLHDCDLRDRLKRELKASGISVQ